MSCVGRRLLQWWESLPGHRRVIIGIPVAWVVLFVFHQAFPLLDQVQRATYATMEAVPIALVIAWATQNELRRRAEADARAAGREEPDGD
jgi:hypothetical protein